MKTIFLGLLLIIAAVCVCARRRYRYYPPPPDPVQGPCGLRPEAGPCRGYCPRYYYDSSRGYCRPFNYGCCGGNANNFKTKALCENVCDQKRVCPAIACFVGACTIQTCPNFPEATCFAVCPCQSLWVYNGEDVTSRCSG